MTYTEFGPQQYPDAVEAAYSDDHIVQAIQQSAWFTPAYILEVDKTEPYPEFLPNFGPYKDPLLQKFINKAYDITAEIRMYRGANIYLAQRMVGSQGHPFTLREIPFVDEEIWALAAQLKIPHNHEFERGMIDEVDFGLQSIIAPLPIRNKVIKINQAWGEGYEERRSDVLLWSQISRKGLIEFLQRPKP